MILKKLSEMSKREIEEIKKKQFLAVPVSDIKGCDYDYAIPVSLEFCEVTSIWHEALEIYLKEHFNESD